MNVWFTSNGERLGTLNGHNGTVWTVAVDCEYCPVGKWIQWKGFEV